MGRRRREKETEHVDQIKRKENVRFNLNSTISAFTFVPKFSSLKQEAFPPSPQVSWVFLLAQLGSSCACSHLEIGLAALLGLLTSLAVTSFKLVQEGLSQDNLSQLHMASYTPEICLGLFSWQRQGLKREQKYSRPLKAQATN